jgi:hypothetical protein
VRLCHPTSVFLLLVFVPLSSGCGVVFQAIAGYNEEETTVEQSTHDVLISTLPKGASVSASTDDQRRELGETPLHVSIPYETEVTIQRPAPMSMFWFGTALDAAAVAIAGLGARAITQHLDHQDERNVIWAAYIYGPVLSLLGEVIVGGILSVRETSVTARHAETASLELTVEKPGFPTFLARVDAPSIGPRVTIPLEPSAALRLNHPGAPLMVVIASSSTVSSRSGR